MEIKAVIFDMDGVLIDAKDWHYEALNRALALVGFQISRYEHLITYDGLSTKTKLEMLSRERALPTSLHPFINEMKQIYTVEIINRLCKPMFIHEYALSKLKQDGIRLTLASNSIRSTVDLMMKRSYLQPYLEFTLSNEDVKRPKPDSEIYLKTIEKLKLKPKECLVIEDNPNGIKSALAAGAHVLEVTSILDVTYDRIHNVIAKSQRGEL